MRSLPWIIAACLLAPASVQAESLAITSTAADTAPAEPEPVAAPVAEPDVREPVVKPEDAAPVASEPAPSTPAVADDDPAKAKQLARNLGEAGTEARPWFVSGTIEGRMLAISDDDPANGRQMFYYLRGGYSLFPGGSLFGVLALNQRFVVEEGESPFLLRDLQLAFQYSHDLPVAIESLGDHTLSLTHRGSLFLPTSRTSQADDLYFALQALHRGRIDIVDRLYLGADLFYSYRFHRFAERGGEQGGMNRRFWFAGQLTLEYNVLEDDTYGFVTLGTGLYSAWYMHYPSRDEHDSEASGSTFWSQEYGWSAYVAYAPLDWLVASLALEQNGNVLDGGFDRVHFLHRDEAELVLTVTARY